MKIIHICWEYIDNYSYQEELLPKAHKKLGHEVVVLTPKKVFASFYKGPQYVSKGPVEYFLEGVKIIRLDYISASSNRFTILYGLYNRLIHEKPDIIFVHMIQSFSLLIANKYVKKHPDCILFADSHADEYNSANNPLSRFLLHRVIWKVVAHISLERLKKVFYVAPMSYTFLRKYYNIPEFKIESLYLGADLDTIDFGRQNEIRSKVRESCKIPKDAIVLISGGKIDPQKNLDNLLMTFALPSFYNIHLIIFGSVEKNYQVDFDKLLSFSSNVHMLGWKNPKEISDLFLASDLAVFPGTQSVLWQQAICAGLPLIVKLWPGGEYLNTGGNVVYLSNNSIEELSSLIQEITNDGNRLSSMKQLSYTYGREKFSYENIAQKVIDISKN